MEKELNKIIQDLEKVLNKLDNDDLETSFIKVMEEALHKPCKISIEKGENGEAKLGISGNRLSLLIALAGAKKGILQKLKCSKEEFEFIENLVGAKEDVEVL